MAVVACLDKSRHNTVAEVADLQREVSARESHGGEGRIRAARFPSLAARRHTLTCIVLMTPPGNHFHTG